MSDSVRDYLDRKQTVVELETIEDLLIIFYEDNKIVFYFFSQLESFLQLLTEFQLFFQVALINIINSELNRGSDTFHLHRALGHRYLLIKHSNSQDSYISRTDLEKLNHNNPNNTPTIILATDIKSLAHENEEIKIKLKHRFNKSIENNIKEINPNYSGKIATKTNAQNKAILNFMCFMNLDLKITLKEIAMRKFLDWCMKVICGDEELIKLTGFIEFETGNSHALTFKANNGRTYPIEKRTLMDAIRKHRNNVFGICPSK